MIDVHLHKRLLPEFSTKKVKVYEVNPTAVTLGNIKFTNAGHHLVYPETIPQGEVWISRDMSYIEKLYYLYHELYEHRQMLKGTTYEIAHNWANSVEGRQRHQLDEHELKKKIKAEMELNKDLMTEPSHFNGHLSLKQDNARHHQHHFQRQHTEGIKKTQKLVMSR
jgi:hypothetical protein